MLTYPCPRSPARVSVLNPVNESDFETHLRNSIFVIQTKKSLPPSLRMFAVDKKTTVCLFLSSSVALSRHQYTRTARQTLGVAVSRHQYTRTARQTLGVAVSRHQYTRTARQTLGVALSRHQYTRIARQTLGVAVSRSRLSSGRATVETCRHWYIYDKLDHQPCRTVYSRSRAVPYKHKRSMFVCCAHYDVTLKMKL